MLDRDGEAGDSESIFQVGCDQVGYDVAERLMDGGGLRIIDRAVQQVGEHDQMTPGPQNSAHLSQRCGQVRQHLDDVAAPDDVEACRFVVQILRGSLTERDLIVDPGILHRRPGSVDMPRDRVDAGAAGAAGAALAAGQLDQVAGVAAADIEDVLTGVKVGIGDVVQLLGTGGFEAEVEFVEQSPERFAVDLGHVHSRKHPQPTARRRAGPRPAMSTGEACSDVDLA